MAIRNFGGFEAGDTTECRATSGTFSVQATHKRTGGYGLQVNPTTTAVGHVELSEPSTSAAGYNGGLAANTLWIGFNFRAITLPAANEEEIATILDGVGAAWNLRITSGGVLKLYKDTTLAGTGTAVLSAGATYYWITMGLTNASVQTVNVGGALDISGTTSGTSNYSLVFLGKRTNRNGQTVDFVYDDYIFDDASAPTRGECRMAVPIGAGAASGWTNGTGTTFAEVDEVPAGSDGTTDTSYIQASATQDNLDHTFDMQSSATIGLSGTVRAVISQVLAKTGSISGTSAVALRTIVSGTAVEMPAAGIELTTSYQTLVDLFIVDPSDSGAWTTAKFDTVEVGMAANTIAQTQRFTTAYAHAWMDSPTQSQATRTMAQHMMRRAA